VFKTSNENFIVFALSLICQIVDSYYIALFYILSLLKVKSLEASHINKGIQWLGESLYERGAIAYYESCNSQSFGYAVQEFLEMKVLEKKSIFLILSEKYRKDEPALQALLDKIGQYRVKPIQGECLTKVVPTKSLRRTIMNSFPFMAKL